MTPSFFFRITALLLLTFLTACGSKEWEITAENKTDSSCTITVLTRDQGIATMKDPEKGRVHVILAGTTESVLIDQLLIERPGKDPVMRHNETLKLGERYKILLSADGSVLTTTEKPNTQR